MAADPLQELGKQAVGEAPDDLGPDLPGWKRQGRASTLEAIEAVALTLRDRPERNPECLLHLRAQLQADWAAEREVKRRDGQRGPGHRALLPQLSQELGAVLEVDPDLLHGFAPRSREQ